MTVLRKTTRTCQFNHRVRIRNDKTTAHPEQKTNLATRPQLSLWLPLYKIEHRGHVMTSRYICAVVALYLNPR
jgi:hypothetical protein